MATLASLVIKLRADVAELKTGMEAARAESRKTGKEIAHSMKKDAKDAVDLLGDAIGIRLPRELKNVIAHSSLVGPAFATAFKAAVVIGFASEVLDLIPKIHTLADEAGGFTQYLRDANNEFKSLNVTALTKLKDLGLADKLAGGISTRRGQLQSEAEALRDQVARQSRLAALALTNPLSAGPGAALATKTFFDKKHLTEVESELKSLDQQFEAVHGSIQRLQQGSNAAGKALADPLMKNLRGTAAAGAAAGDELAKMLDRISAIMERERQRTSPIAFEVEQLDKTIAELQAGAELIIERTGVVDRNIAIAIQGMIDRRTQLNEELTNSLDRALREAAMVQGKGLGKAINDTAVIPQLAAQTENLTGKVSDLEAAARSMGEELGGAFANARLAGLQLDDILRLLIVSLIKFIFQAYIIKNLSDSGMGGFLKGFVSALFGGFKAEGGPVSAGTAYVVGEQGPEIFVPPAAGNIVPNGAMGGTTYNIDARGADAGVEVRVMRAIQASGDQSVARAVNIITERNRRSA